MIAILTSSITLWSGLALAVLLGVAYLLARAHEAGEAERALADLQLSATNSKARADVDTSVASASDDDVAVRLRTWQRDR